MKNMRYLFFAAIFSLASCGSKSPEEQKEAAENEKRTLLLNEVNQLEKQMHGSMELNKELATKSLKAYSDFIAAFPKDSLSADYLFKSAELATATQQYSQAYAYYQTIENNHTGYKLYPEVLFLKAALLDNFLNDDPEAKKAYEKLIREFPASPYVADAKAAISNLGKTDDELIKEFQAKNKIK